MVTGIYSLKGGLGMFGKDIRQQLFAVMVKWDIHVQRYQWRGRGGTRGWGQLPPRLDLFSSSKSLLVLQSCPPAHPRHLDLVTWPQATITVSTSKLGCKFYTLLCENGPHPIPICFMLFGACTAQLVNSEQSYRQCEQHQIVLNQSLACLKASAA